jgi:hypothetical protein
MDVIALGQVDEVTVAVPIEVTCHKLPALNIVAGPGLEEADGEAAYAIGDPGVDVV